MNMKSISKLKNLRGSSVLVRVDFNVPIQKGEVVEYNKILASLPTIKLLRKKGARVVLISHLGRPGGKRVASLSLKPVATTLGELLKHDVSFVSFGRAKKHIADMSDGDVVLLENIRFQKDEKKNTGDLAKKLSQLGDFFVLDGFAVAHRASASVVGIAEYLPSYAGLLLEHEIKGLQKVLVRPKSPFVAVVGGAKIETKIPVLKAMLTKADVILTGGGLVNTHLYAKGYGIGDSLVDKDFAKEAKKYCASAKIPKPVDVVVGNMEGTEYRIVKIKKQKHEICKKGEMILDVGPETILSYAGYIKKAKTIVWNGAMGYFEQEPYNIATMAIGGTIAERAAQKSVYAVVGGGETVQVMELLHQSKNIDLVSTGGGAMLEFLAGNELPGIQALQ